MSDSSEESAEREGAVEHLDSALSADRLDDAKYHVRQALQLLDVE
ncbi:hypothetical protein [Halorussus limi]|nr:hypothetical protein [Halorussus limi]